MEVVVYSKPDCMQCEQTKKLLERKGVAFSVVDISVDEKALEKVRDLGYRQAPVVVAGEQHWAGFNPARINSLVK